MIEYFLTYFVAINVITFLAFAIDKRNAKAGATRVSEKTLLFLSFLFGALGGLISMYAFHHKTKKPKFYLTVPLLLVVQICFFIYILIK